MKAVGSHGERARIPNGSDRESILGNPGTAWKVAGVGDFNGDGRSDILWRNDDGTVAEWQMNGATPLSTTILGNPGTAWHPT
jgi:hypothetical protein